MAIWNESNGYLMVGEYCLLVEHCWACTRSLGLIRLHGSLLPIGNDHFSTVLKPVRISILFAIHIGLKNETCAQCDEFMQSIIALESWAYMVALKFTTVCSFLIQHTKHEKWLQVERESASFSKETILMKCT